MTYAQFNRATGLTQADFCQEMLAGHRHRIKAKKETTATRNLELIFAATLRLSNQKGFAAMTMRDLSRVSGISMGALYDYFASKEELLEMIQSTGRRITGRVMRESFEEQDPPARKLAQAIRTHLYLSEAMQPWFFFAYMEARHLGTGEKERAKKSELFTEDIFEQIIAQGRAQGLFGQVNPQLVASAVKALLQDWYLKRWKYAKRRVNVDAYAHFVVNLISGYCRDPGGPAGPENGMEP